MPTDKPDATAIDLRLGLLAYNARWYKDGLYRSAMQAAGARSMQELLRDLGRKGPQNVDERAFLYELLLLIGEGRNVVKALRIEPHKVGHVEASPLNAQIVHEVDELIAADVAPKEAIEMVAKAVKRYYSIGAIHKIYDRRKDKS